MKTKHILPLTMSLILMFSQIGGTINVQVCAETENKTYVSSENLQKSGYIAYLTEISGTNAASEDIILENNNNKVCQAETLLEYNIDVPKTALYEFALEYVGKSSADAIVKIQIDGEVPFDEANRLLFPSYWKNAGEIISDENGNQTVPEQVLDTSAVYIAAQDRSGISATPYRFLLTEGAHKIQIAFTQGEIILKKAAFTVPEQPVDYDETVAGKEIAFSGEQIVIEGEDAARKSSRALIPLSNGSSVAVHPSDPTKSLLNYIGGSNWKSPGETLTWDFNVETAGYYSLGVQYRQNSVVGGVSYRKLKIDGNIPFTEAGQIKFKYSNDWDYLPFADSDGNDYLIYLEAGNHTLSLSVTPGSIADVYSELQSIVSDLGNLYVDITMIVGETVDIYRSYNLFEQISDFQERLQSNYNALKNLIDEMQMLQEAKSGSQISVLENMAEVLRQMYDRPYTAHRYKSTYYNNYTNLSAIASELIYMPLDIDRIYLLGNENADPEEKVNFFNKMWFSARRIAASFTDDYNAVGSESANSEDLTIWVNWGRDQAQVLDSLIRNNFVREYGINVNIRVTNATLIMGMLAGNGPDCMLQMSRSEPVNFAMRGALIDLSRFSDFEETAGLFVKGACVPYQYREGTYALPDTQNFYVQYVRTDILEEMGLKIPDTWDEFLYIASVLQRNNLQASLPYTSTLDGNLYTTLLLQNDLELFSNDLGSSLLTSTEQIKIFKMWTSWYTEYKIPTTMDFYNRFRIGSAPIGIASYTLYNQIKQAAPELEGRWEITMIPGTRKSDGSISRTVSGSGTGCGITTLAKNPENAWKFIKWWVSANTQIQYSNRLESLLGSVGRVAVSNVNALEDLGWDKNTLTVLQNQQCHVLEFQEVPGSYYVSRGIDQAFWNVVEQEANPTDTMLKWGAVVDTEIKRKTDEYKNK